MLIALGGVIAGYDESFSFERIGLEYPDTVPYVQLRLVSFYLLLTFRFYIVVLCSMLLYVSQYYKLCSIMPLLGKMRGSLRHWEVSK